MKNMPNQTRRLPKVTEYVKNVGKSVAFAAIDIIKEDSGEIFDLAKDTKDIFKDVYGSVRETRRSMMMQNRDERRTGVFKAVDEGLKTFLNDVKSGNLYDSHDEDSLEDFGLGEFDEADLESLGIGQSEDSPKKGSGKKAASSTKVLSDNFSKSIGAAANAQAYATAQSADLTIRSSRANTKIILSHLDRITGRMNSNFVAVHGAIETTNKFLSGPIQTHIENSTKYYNESIKLFQEQNAMIREMLEMQRNLYNDQSSSSSSSSNSSQYDKVLGMGVDLREYGKQIKKNVFDDLFMGSFDLLNSFDMSDMTGKKQKGGLEKSIKMFANGLAKNMTTAAVTKMMPKDFREALKSLNNTLAAIPAAFIGRMSDAKSKGFDGSLMSILAQVFGLNINEKTSLNTNAFRKGAVPFDGETRQSIIEVIPGYLARIEAALTGQEERHYDIGSGRWKSVSAMRRDYEDIKKNAIASANYDMRSDTRDYLSELERTNPRAAKQFKKDMEALASKLYEDNGNFNKNWKNNGMDNIEAWKYYNQSSQQNFDRLISLLSNETIIGMQKNNISAKQRTASVMKEMEKNGDLAIKFYNGAFAGADDEKPYDYKGGAVGKKANFLTASTDTQGHNVFYYLREILSIMKTGRGGRLKGRSRRGRGGPNGSPTDGSGEGDSGSDSSDDGPEPEEDLDDEDLFAEADRAYEEKQKAKQEKSKLGDWLKNKLGNTPVANVIANVLNAANSVLGKPMGFITNLIQKADKSLFTMMFGDKMQREIDGEPTDSVFDYIVKKVKSSFEKITDSIKKWIHEKFVNEFLMKKLKPIWDKFWEKWGKPVTDEVKSTFNKGKDVVKGEYVRLGTSIKNRLGLAHHEASATGSPEDVVTPEDIENGGAPDSGTIPLNARGARMVRTHNGQPGLTMVSNGETIIPASRNPAALQMMENQEAAARGRIIDHVIGLHAKGRQPGQNESSYSQYNQAPDWSNFYDKAKETLNLNKDNVVKTVAHSILGGAAGLVLGNPLLGAMVGAGVSIVSRSSKLQEIVFGKIGEDGTEEKKGLIPKQIQDLFKKSAPNMLTGGVIGGTLGLFTGFGPLGGAAIGAGLGLVKNTETFQRFIFGNEELGEEGILDKKKFEEFKKKLGKSAPAMGIGAAAGAMLGPFGLMGNLILGSGLGFVASTEKFRNFLFGANEDSPGLLGAAMNGIFEPAKKGIKNIMEDFRGWFKEKLFDKAQLFLRELLLGINDSIKGLVANIGDHFRESMENSIMGPIADFLQEKIFKPFTKTTMVLTRGLLAVPKKLIEAPFALMGQIGAGIQNRRIQAGTASNMTAKQRLDFRNQHKFRSAMGQINHKDKFLDADAKLAASSQEELQNLFIALNGSMKNRDQLHDEMMAAGTDVANSMSGFLNERVDGVQRFDSLGRKKVKQLEEYRKLIGEGEYDKADELLKSIDMSPEDREAFRNRMESSILRRKTAAKNLSDFDNGTTSADYQAVVDEYLGYTDGKHASRHEMEKLLANARTEYLFNQKEENAKKMSEEEKEKAANDDPIGYQINKYRAEHKEEFAKLYDRIAAIAKAINPNANINDDNTVTFTEPEEETTAEGEGAEGVTEGEGGEKTDEGEGKEKSLSDIVDEAVAENAAPKEMPDVLGSKTGGSSEESSEDDKTDASESEFDSKEAVEERAEEAAKDKVDTDNLEENRKSTSILQKIHDKFFGKKEDKQKKKDDGGFLGGLLGKFGDLLGFLGGGLGKAGKIALGIGAFSLIGHLSQWLKTAVYGTDATNADQQKNEKKGILGKIGDGLKSVLGGLWDKIKGFIVGEDGKGGLVGKIRNWLENGGLTKVVRGVGNYIITGIGYGVNNLIAPLFETLVRYLPSFLKQAAIGIVNGLKHIFISDKTYSSNVDYGSSAASVIQKSVNDNNSKIASIATTSTSGNARNVFGNYSGVQASNADYFASGPDGGGTATIHPSDDPTMQAYYDAATSGDDTYIDDDTYVTSNQGKWKQKGLKLFGKAERTNEIDYDENGNRITSYTQMNERQNALGQIASSAGKGFVRHALGYGGTTLLTNLGKVATGVGKVGKAIASKTGVVGKAAGLIGKGVGKVGKTVASFIPGAKLASGMGKLTKGIGKAVGGVTENAVKAGDKVNGALSKFSGKLLGSADDVAAATADQVAKGADNFVDDVFIKMVNENAVSKGTASAIDDIVAGSADDMASAATSAVGDALANSADDAIAGAAKSGFVSKLVSIFQGIAKSKVGTFLLKACSKETTQATICKALETLGSKLGNSIFGKLGKTALSKVSGALAQYSPIGLAMLVIDFISGYRNAYTILGIPKGGEYKVKIWQKLVCGLVNMINNKLTLGLLPINIIMDLALWVFKNILHIDTTEIDKARSDENVNAVLDQWNAEHPDEQYDNLEDFNNKDKWWAKAGRAIKNFFHIGKGREDDDKAFEAAYDIEEQKKIVEENRDKLNNAVNASTASATSGKAHAYQRDKSIAGMKYGKSTIGDAGCAPVAATNAVNRAMNSETATDVRKAARYAEQNNMIASDGGTDIGYFKSFFRSKGLDSTPTRNFADVMQAINRGEQAIILGRDEDNSRTSPFGTTAHYMTAVGTRGNDILVEDPDSDKPITTYRKDRIKKAMKDSVILHNPKSASSNKSIAKYVKSGFGRVNGRTIRSGKRASKQDIKNYHDSDYIAACAYNEFLHNEHGNQATYAKLATGKTSSYAGAWCCLFVWYIYNISGASQYFVGGDLEVTTGDMWDYFDSYEPERIVHYARDANHTEDSVHENSNDEVIYGDGTSSNYTGYRTPGKRFNSKDVSQIKPGDIVIFGDGNYNFVKTIRLGSGSGWHTGIIYAIVPFSALEASSSGTYYNGKLVYKSNFTDSDADYCLITVEGNTTANDGSSGSCLELKARRLSNVDCIISAPDSFKFDETGLELNFGDSDVGTAATDLAISMSDEGAAEQVKKSKEQQYLNTMGDAGNPTEVDTQRSGYAPSSSGDSSSPTSLVDILAKAGDMYARALFGDTPIDTLFGGSDSSNGTEEETNQSGSGRRRSGKGKSNAKTGYAAAALTNHKRISGYSDDDGETMDSIIQEASKEYDAMSGKAKSSALRNNSVDSMTFLTTVIQLLMKISDNTATLNAIETILAEKLDIPLSGTPNQGSSIDQAAEKASGDATAQLRDLMRKSKGNVSGLSSILNDGTNDFIIQAMKAIAEE